MTTITFTLTMPDDLAAEAKEVGLFSPSVLLQLIRKEVQQRRVESLFQAADRLAALDDLPLTENELSVELAAARNEKRSPHASGT